MCAGRQPRWSFRYLLTNWQQPMPLRAKLGWVVKNTWIRLTTPALCCGNEGKPGC
jgi:hypothetical protein